MFKLQRIVPPTIRMVVFLTSLDGALFSLRADEGVDEVGEGAVAAEELLVGAALCDLSISQDEDEVSLWQEAHPVGHQDASLYRRPHKGENEQSNT